MRLDDLAAVLGLPLARINSRLAGNLSLKGVLPDLYLTARLKATGTALEYEIQSQWTLPRESPLGVPYQGQSKWKGIIPHHPGETLVLNHREQIPTGKEASVTQEIWALVTARWIAR